LPGVGESRFVRLARRRPTLVRFLTALLVFRIVTTITEFIEQRITYWSLLITVVLAIETWRAWQVAHAAGAATTDPTATKWDRFLNPFERYGALVCWVLTALYVVGYVVLKAEGVNAHTVIDVVTLVRELQFLVLLGVLLAGFAAVREADGGAGDPARARA
jgi:hypothetical protein